MKKQIVLLATMVILAAICSAEILHAEMIEPVVLDQCFDPPDPHTHTTFHAGWGAVAQTFTVGRTGVLSGVEVFVASGDYPDLSDLLVYLYDVEDGAPHTILAETADSSVPIGTFVWAHWDVSSHSIRVAPGDQMAIVLASAGLSSYTWMGQIDGEQYEEGDALVQYAGQSEWAPTVPSQDHSLLFRTYVQVPEPSMLALLTVCAAGFLVCRGRR
jgi:hypothetical protein